MSLKENLQAVRERMNAAMAESGRKDEVLLVGVTKTFPASVIEDSIDCEIFDVGENKAQEFTEKYDIIGDRVNWHFIGHLQKNKVKYVAGKVKLIHSVDSLELAREIDRRAGQREKVQDVLLEVNVSGEESKFGLSPDAVEDLLLAVAGLEHLRVRGLMTMAPNVQDESLVRGVFRGLRELRDELKGKSFGKASLDYLSMGMSQDYHLAILEGANIIRVGSSLYGKR